MVAHDRITDFKTFARNIWLNILKLGAIDNLQVGIVSIGKYLVTKKKVLNNFIYT